MKDKILVYSVSGWINDVEWITDYEITDDIEKAKIVVFPGGADVNPKLYGFGLHPNTHYSDAADSRDLAAWKKLKPEQLAVGICRGAQFLCVANGGKLIQDVSGHAIGRTHAIRTTMSPTIELQAISLHHQMMYPFNLSNNDYTMLYSSFCASDISNIATDDAGKRLNLDPVYSFGEPEVVLFHKNNSPMCLAIQSHPEMMRIESSFVKEMNKLIVNLLK